MRALIVDRDKSRVNDVRDALTEGGTSTEVVGSWSEASSRLSDRPDLVVVAFEQLVEDGLDSLLAADAELKVQKIPAFLTHSLEEASEVDTVRALANFVDTIELPREGDRLAERLHNVISRISGAVPSDAGIATSFEAAVWTREDSQILDFGALVDGRYQIEEFVAAGGMGNIYRALQQPLERPVALKVIRGELSQDSDAIARFRLEARTVSRLNHPHTIVLYDYGIDANGLMYLAMEWLEGETLADHFDEGRRFTPTEAARIARQVAESLGEAHRKGIVHRDLKPGNIFLVDDQAEPDFVKVLDFGIAKLMDNNSTAGSITRVGTICGTPEFMSPEQARGEELDGRSDVYALGCCIHAMLTGDPPFLDEQPLQIIMRHQTDPLPDPGDDVPEALKAIINRCTAKEVDDRFHDAGAVVTALDTFLENPEVNPERSEFKPIDSNARTILPDDVLDGSTSAEFDREPSRVLSVPDLTGGRLGQPSLARLLHLLAFHQKTGRLTVSRNAQEKTMDMVLGLICRDDVDGFLPAFGWQTGEWTFQETVPAPGGTVDALQVIYDGLRRHASVNEMAMKLAEKNDLYAVRSTLYEQRRVSWDAHGRVAEVFALCDGATTVSELMSSGIGFDVVTRSLHLGEETDAVMFVDSPTTPPLAVSYGLAKSETRLLSLESQAEIDRIQTALNELIQGEPYTAFGLEPGCGEAVVEARFRDLEQKYVGRLSETAAIRRKQEELQEALRSTRDKILEQERAPKELTGEERRVLEELEATRSRFAGSDPYGSFQLWDGCGRNAVEDKFFELVNRHHPDQFAPYGREKITAAADEVFIELQKVYRLLLDREKTDEPTRERSGSKETSETTEQRSKGRSHSGRRPATSPRREADDAFESPSPSGGATRVKVKLPSRPVSSSRHKRPGRSTSTRHAEVNFQSGKRSAPAAPPRRGTSSTDTGRPGIADRDVPEQHSDGRRQRKMSEILAERARQAEEEGGGTELKKGQEQKPRRPRTGRIRPDTTSLRAKKTPTEHARQGKRFLEQNNLDSARRAFEAARELAPNDFSYAAHLAWIDYLCDPTTVSDVVDRLKKMRKKPGGREANYFLGKISFREGELSSARRYYENTLRDKENHVEARRELRLVKMRLSEQAESKENAGGLFNRLVNKVKSKLE